jgi:hypothetical protein
MECFQTTLSQIYSLHPLSEDLLSICMFTAQAIRIIPVIESLLGVAQRQKDRNIPVV